jgi:CheY-like chemotaxis protein
LLIDDDEDDFELFNNALKEIAPELKGMLLTNVTDIVGYFDSLAPHDLPCLVVTDLNLPPSDGFEVIDKLKHDTRYSYIPIIVYSNSANPRDIEKARQAGATAYIHKATSISEINEDVREMVRYCMVT